MPRAHQKGFVFARISGAGGGRGGSKTGHEQPSSAPLLLHRPPGVRGRLPFHAAGPAASESTRIGRARGPYHRRGRPPGTDHSEKASKGALAPPLQTVPLRLAAHPGPPRGHPAHTWRPHPGRETMPWLHCRCHDCDRRRPPWAPMGRLSARVLGSAVPGGGPSGPRGHAMASLPLPGLPRGQLAAHPAARPPEARPWHG